MPAASNVPPQFIPTAASAPPGSRRASHRLISCMHGHAGRSRLARGTASPMWSKWPCVTSNRSQRSIESAVRGLFGLAKNGSMMMVLPPGVRTSKQLWPYQVNVVSRSRDMRGHLRARCYNAATLDPVSATQIGQNLAFVNWMVLTGLALGTFAAIVLLRRRTTATPGYLRFAAMCALGFGILAWISDGALPAALADSPVVVHPVWDEPRRLALGVFTIFVALGIALGRARLGVRVALEAG